MQPRLYSDLAPWWPLVSDAGDYALEAAAYRDLLLAAPGRDVLELGCGGGHTASHLKRDFELTLTDCAPAMLAASQRLNPECRHQEGDMRTLRLQRTFSAVFVHDAVGYMTSAADLRAALATARRHCRPGGLALFVPDCVRETFEPGLSSGGNDRQDRAVRFLEWVHDPDPSDDTYAVDYAFLLREGSEPVRVVHDFHVLGLFARADWLQWLDAAGFAPELRRVPTDQGEHEVFVGVCR